MTKKMYLGIAALIVFMIAAGGFIYWQVSTMQQLKEQAAQFEKMIEKIDKPVLAKDPPPAAPGKKWVPHGDHFHEVPIDAPDVWQGEPHEPVVPQKQHTVDASGKVIYPHQELLDTHPVKALRAQAKEAGHWSAPYIPPFPPDDAEANMLAYNQYIRNYHVLRGSYYHPDANKAAAVLSKWRADNLTKPGNYSEPRPREFDLFRLSWTDSDDPGSGEFAWTNLVWEMESNFTREEYENANNQ